MTELPVVTCPKNPKKELERLSDCDLCTKWDQECSKAWQVPTRRGAYYGSKHGGVMP